MSCTNDIISINDSCDFLWCTDSRGLVYIKSSEARKMNWKCSSKRQSDQWSVSCWNTRFDGAFHAGLHDSMKCFMLEYTIRWIVSCCNTRFEEVFHAGIHDFMMYIMREYKTYWEDHLVAVMLGFCTRLSVPNLSANSN